MDKNEKWMFTHFWSSYS